jgi:son of sevenless-like protein
MSPKIIVPTLNNALSTLIPDLPDDDERNVVVRRASRLLSEWVNNCYQDFQFDKQVVEELFSFIGNTLNTFLSKADLEGHYKAQERVVEMCEVIAKKISGMEDEIVAKTVDPPPKSIVMSRIPNDPRTLKVEDIHPVELARQLTIMEFNIFGKVNAEELLGLGWMKESKEWTAPNITQLISRSNQITDWVTTYILNIPKLKQRQRVLKHFLAVADACYEMKNFNTLFEIMMALVSQPIYRLKQTWEGIGRTDREKYIKYDSITNFAGNRRAYREELKLVNLGKEPCLPYIGVHLTDLVFFDQGNTGHKFEGELMYINLTKRSQMALVVNQLTLSQRCMYSFRNVEYIQMFLTWQLNANVTSDEELMHKLSKSIEP